jgi:hypothetical protein
LKDENLGTTRSAAVFIKLLNVARESKMEDIYKVLKSSKNKDILYVLRLIHTYHAVPMPFPFHAVPH